MLSHSPFWLSTTRGNTVVALQKNARMQITECLLQTKRAQSLGFALTPMILDQNVAEGRSPLTWRESKVEGDFYNQISFCC